MDRITDNVKGGPSVENIGGTNKHSWGYEPWEAVSCGEPQKVLTLVTPSKQTIETSEYFLEECRVPSADPPSIRIHAPRPLPRVKPLHASERHSLI